MLRGGRLNGGDTRVDLFISSSMLWLVTDVGRLYLPLSAVALAVVSDDRLLPVADAELSALLCANEHLQQNIEPVTL